MLLSQKIYLISSLIALTAPVNVLAVSSLNKKLWINDVSMLANFS